jgi:hypothetical protein
VLPDWFETRYEVLPNGCWEWQGSRRDTGYGRCKWNGVLREAHRMSYEHYVGPIPEGLVLDHYKHPQDGCIGPSCCNPAHVRPASRRENTLRSDTPAARQLAQTECVHGHKYTPENTIYDKRGRRNCRICKNARERKRYAERRAA